MSATEKYRSSNAADRLLHPNSLDSYLLGSRDVAGMRTGDDGAITILVQHDPPVPELLGNWLPSPAGAFNLAFRMYLPGAAIRSGERTAPQVMPVDEG